MLCNAKCPGGIKGAGMLGAGLSALNPLTLLSKKDEEEEKEAQEETDPMKKMFKQMDYIEPRLPLLVGMISPTVSASVTLHMGALRRKKFAT
ncbi:unnamed protein product [Symbiodinium sp. CCMP2592]|nr:unnamed protein product [Symbiodinium sp. CCMP2592]